MDVYSTIEYLPQLYNISKTICEACHYIEGDFEARKLEMEESIQSGIEVLETKATELFEKMDEEAEKEAEKLKKEPTVTQCNIWFAKYWLFALKETFKQLGSMRVNGWVNPKSCDKERLIGVLTIFQDLKLNKNVVAQMKLCLFELCRYSSPDFAYKLLMEAFSEYPDMVVSWNIEHLKNYHFSDKVVAEQKEFKQCPICGNIGVSYYAAPAYLLSSFNKDFLPAKLWMKCECCGNLYTRYFPKKFSTRNNPLKLIIPRENVEQKLVRDVSVTILRTWCDMLQNMKQYTKGKNILEIGVGKGALIATAIEMGYPIDCVEIEEAVAQNIADLLQHPVICCDFLDLPEEKNYDIISMGDVIEHLDDPRKGLEKAKRLLKEDGVIWISTPNYNSAFNQLNRNRTAMWGEPWHITYFSREGLEKLLNEVGFAVLDYRISNHYNGSMEMIVQKKKN